MRDKRKSLRDHKKSHRNANKASYVQKKPARKFAKTDKSKLIQKIQILKINPHVTKSN